MVFSRVKFVYLSANSVRTPPQNSRDNISPWKSIRENKDTHLK